jgi:hypothetical protein
MRLRCYVGKSIQLNFAGYSLAGLFSQPDCNATLEVVDWIDDPQSIAIEADGARLVLEVHDQSDKWCLPLLEWCDVYAKRNIDPAITTPLQHKIVPFGMNVACHSRRSALAVLSAIAAAFPSGFRPRPKDIYLYLVTPHWRDLEYHPDLPVNGNVLFQTRVWEPSDAPNDEGINDERIALLRALRVEFKHRFAGGLVHTSYSRKHYPELLTDVSTRQPQYIQWAKQHGVAVYSRGLFGSTAFKMPEYLAASKCIVADRIRYELPAPLAHMPAYDSPEACVVQCQNLLSKPSLMREQRHASWEYYNKYLRPPTAMRRLLDLALLRKSLSRVTSASPQ